MVIQERASNRIGTWISNRTVTGYTFVILGLCGRMVCRWSKWILYVTECAVPERLQKETHWDRIPDKVVTGKTVVVPARVTIRVWPVRVNTTCIRGVTTRTRIKTCTIFIPFAWQPIFSACSRRNRCSHQEMVPVGDMCIINNVRVFVTETAVSFCQIVKGCIRYTNNLIDRWWRNIRPNWDRKYQGNG